MPTRENQYARHDKSVWNSHLPSQNVFLQSVIYSTKKTIILAWGKSRVFSTDPPFLHRRDNNDCRPLHETWRTLSALCKNKHLINKAVGRTQKTSFPLSSISKASLCSDFKTNHSSYASKSRQSISVFSIACEAPDAFPVVAGEKRRPEMRLALRRLWYGRQTHRRTDKWLPKFTFLGWIKNQILLAMRLSSRRLAHPWSSAKTYLK